MQTETIKKRGRKPGVKNGSSATPAKGLPTTGSIITPALFQAIQKCTRAYDAKELTEHLAGKWSGPVIRNLLNNGYCTDAALYNAVAKFFNDRRDRENAIADELLQSDLTNVEVKIKLLTEKKGELKILFESLK